MPGFTHEGFAVYSTTVKFITVLGDGRSNYRYQKLAAWIKLHMKIVNYFCEKQTRKFCCPQIHDSTTIVTMHSERLPVSVSNYIVILSNH